MRKRKPIGIERASKLMHDLGLRTPEDIKRQFERLSAYGKFGQSPVNPIQLFPIERLIVLPGNHGLKPGYYERKPRAMADIPVIDFVLIEETGNRCGCCHQPIKAREGIAFGRPGLLGGRVPPINVCAECVRLAQIHLESAKEGLI